MTGFEIRHLDGEKRSGVVEFEFKIRRSEDLEPETGTDDGNERELAKKTVKLERD